MKRFSFKKKLLAGAAAAALVAGAGGAAFAYWTSNGGGDGTATSSSASSVAISVPLGIGNFTGLDTTKTFDVLLTNNNSGSVSVAGKTLTLTSVDCTGGVGPSAVPATPSWFSLGGVVAAPSTTIAGGGGTAPISGVTLTLVGDTSNQDSCQGAAITAHFSLT